MRKPRRLSLDELAPYLWEMPAARGQEPVQESGAREQGPGTRNQETIQELGKKTLSPRPLVPDSWPLAPEPVPGPWPLAPFLDWAALFGNANPVEVEVGMGKGLFLLTQATARPHVNFFGLEIVRKYQLYATTRVAIRRLPNARTACADAGWVFRRFVPPGSVSAVHVLFPDPWWKKRHRKRRVFTPGFAADAARALTPGGRIHVASDVEEYFGVMTDILRTMPAFREMPPDAAAGLTTCETNFERKARVKGTPVWRGVYERTADPVASDPADSPPASRVKRGPPTPPR